MKKILIVALSLVVIALVTASIWPGGKQKQTTPTSTANNTSQTETRAPNQSHDHEAVARVPAYYKTAPTERSLRPTLPPETFTGNVRLAYEAAKDIPEILAQVPCYCHCDMSQGHKSLHSCFEDQHGENCGICIGEALMARSLHRQGLTPVQIRERIISAYGKEKD